jgi:hypothetical protein
MACVVKASIRGVSISPDGLGIGIRFGRVSVFSLENDSDTTTFAF